jgi:hypothetical protein
MGSLSSHPVFLRLIRESSDGNGTVKGTIPMNDLNALAKTENEGVLHELDCSRLAEVTGGSTLPYGSTFSEWPPRPNPVLVLPQPFNFDEAPSPGVHIVQA